MKVAFVVQRCGEEVLGGAEALTLQVGKKLSEKIDIEILTTRAKDASTWKNYYPEGIKKIDNLKIRRFSVDSNRDPNFVPLSQYLELHNEDISKGEEFLNASGPVCTKLLDFIKENKNNYDLFVFVGYLYWQTYYIIQEVAEKSLLLPTAHDEPWIYFKIYEKVFQSPLGYLFLTNAEKEFVHEKLKYNSKPYQIVDHGIDIISPKQSVKIKNLPQDYILYIGRISNGKGCQLLVDYFNEYSKQYPSKLKLVLLGTLEHKLLNCDAIVLENLSDDEKLVVLENCKFFIMPSQNESLNMACLEAWSLQKSVLVNVKSEVLKEHCIRGNCGLYFNDFAEFSKCVDLLLNDNSIAMTLGKNGKNYVLNYYNWGKTTKKYISFFEKFIEK